MAVLIAKQGKINHHLNIGRNAIQRSNGLLRNIIELSYAFCILTSFELLTAFNYSAILS